MGFLKKISLAVLLLLFVRCNTLLIVKGTYIHSDKGVLSYGNSPERNFYIDEALGDSLVEIWENDFYGGFGNQSILAQNGNIFFADLGGRVYIIDAATGKKIGYEENKGEIAVTPVIHQRRIIYGLNDEDEIHSTLIFFDLIRSNKDFEIQVDGYISNEFVMLSDGLIVLLQNGDLQKYSFLGRKIWELKTGVLSQFDPASDGDLIVFGNQDGELIIVNSAGKIVTRKKIANSFESGAAIKNGKAYLGDTDGNLFCISIDSAEILWQQKCDSKIVQIPVCDNNTLFVGSLTGYFYSIDLLSGKILWEISTDGLINTPGLVFKDVIIQPDYSGRILLISKANGEIKNEFEYNNKVNFAPVYHKGTVFWGSYRSNIYAFKRAENK